jgi:hypothetical protein
MHVVADIEFSGYVDLSSSIKKTIRFKSGGTIVATLNVQGGWRFDFADSGGGYHDQPEGTIASHGPNSFIGQRRRLEAMVDFTDETAPLFGLWVDGTEIMAGESSEAFDYPGGNVDGAVISTIFNGPAATGTDTIRQIIFADSFVGVDEPEPEESNGITATGLTASRMTASRITGSGL